MKPAIIIKLREQIKKNIGDEPQVVYILTRIGKILELEGNENEYPILKFYRDWVVHIILNKKKHDRVVDILKEFIRNKENRVNFCLHTQFSSELDTFMKKHNLPNLNKSRLNNFIFFLGKAISDTPIEVGVNGQTYSISINEPLNKSSSGTYCVTPIL